MNMKQAVHRYLELLERRLVALRMLAADLSESKSAYVELDLHAMHQHIAQQENLCTEMRLLDVELKTVREQLADGTGPAGTMSAWRTLEAQLDPAAARQLQLLLGGMAAIQEDVRRLSRVHSELLRRSRRSVNVLLNFLAHYSGTYTVPAVQPKGKLLMSGVK
jgi:hypothetical protein